jgi:hypothetical protein
MPNTALALLDTVTEPAISIFFRRPCLRATCALPQCGQGSGRCSVCGTQADRGVVPGIGRMHGRLPRMSCSYCPKARVLPNLPYLQERTFRIVVSADLDNLVATLTILITIPRPFPAPPRTR